MSSIYRKGRDGYYYYQAYIYNSKTGKRDKRIFHSLGTKDLLEAQSKKLTLDEKYSKEKRKDNKIVTYLFNKKYSVLISIIIACLIFYNEQLINTFLSIGADKNYMKDIDNNRLDKNFTFDNNLSKKNKIDTTTKSDTYIVNKKETKKNLIHINKELNKSTELELKTIKKLSLPKYDIQRIEKISGVFNQGKIYITTSIASSKEQLLLICNKIRSEHPEFSNLIICLYSDSRIGERLANGYEAGISIEKINKQWLAMYTFNSVEGEYFDDQPGSYLGVQ